MLPYLKMLPYLDTLAKKSLEEENNKERKRYGYDKHISF